MVDLPASTDAPPPSTPTTSSSPQLPFYTPSTPSTNKSRTAPSTPNPSSSPYSTPMSPTYSTRTFDRGASARPRLSRSSTISSSCSSRPSFASRQSFTSSSGVSEASSSTITSTSTRSSTNSVTVSRMIDGKGHDVTIHYSNTLVAGIQAAGMLRDDFWHLSLKQAEDGTADGWIKLPPLPLDTSAKMDRSEESKAVGGGIGTGGDVDVFEAMFSGGEGTREHLDDLSVTILGSGSNVVRHPRA